MHKELYCYITVAVADADADADQNNQNFKHDKNKACKICRNVYNRYR